MRDEATLEPMARAILEAWSAQDVDGVLAHYTLDLVYRDPNTRGEVRGRDAMRRYLEKLFRGWTMRWSLREVHPLSGGEGAAILWRATFRAAGGDGEVQTDGMDLVRLRGDRIERNEVWFDRAALAPLQGAAPPQVAQARQLLLRGWMTHDAMWLRHCVERFGMEAANQVNQAAVRSMATVEIRRLLQAFGIPEVRSMDALRALVERAWELIGADFMDFECTWPAPDTMRWEALRCFAFEGVTRLGVVDAYDCGIMPRMEAWFDALGLRYTVQPRGEGCMMHRTGSCHREYRFTFGEAAS